MFDEYNALFEKLDNQKNIDYKFLEEEIKPEWDRLTYKFFKHSSKKEIIEALQSVYFNLDRINKKKCLKDFISYLDYASDRMNINRWCRLQIYLENAIENEYDKVGNKKGE